MATLNFWSVWTIVISVFGLSLQRPARAAEIQRTRHADVLFTKVGLKKFYFVDPESRSTLAHSVAETLFWSDVMMEHAQIFAAFLEGEKFKELRAEATSFEEFFRNLHARVLASDFDSTSLNLLNRSTIDFVWNFYRFKMRLHDLQDRGEISTPIQSEFFEHTAQEAQYFAYKLDRINTDVTELGRSQVIFHWTHIMADHGKFIAAFLSANENQRRTEALDFSKRSSDLGWLNSTSADYELIRKESRKVVDHIIDFSSKLLDDVARRTIEGRMTPALADHFLRETVKFKEELHRAR